MKPFFATNLAFNVAILTVAVIGLVIASVAESEEYFDDRLCAPLEVIEDGAAYHAQDGKNVDIEYADNGDFQVTVDHNLTIWRQMEGTTLFCMQEHLGGIGV